MCWSNPQFLVCFFGILLVNLSQPYEYFVFITLQTIEPGKKTFVTKISLLSTSFQSSHPPMFLFMFMFSTLGSH